MKGFAFIAVTILLFAFSAFGQKGAAGKGGSPLTRRKPWKRSSTG